jgi:Uma2 family endonuclease
MTTQRTRITQAEFEQFLALPENADRRFELINGEIIEKMPTEEHGVIAVKLILRVGGHIETHQLGRLAVEPRHKMPDDDQDARLPDIAFTSNARLLPLVRQGAVPQMPDLVIEIKSPDDSEKKMAAKAHYYLANGSRMVVLVFPERRQFKVFTPDAEYLLSEADVFEGGDVLPGFSLRVGEVFPQV